MVSIPACHAGDRGSIPRRGVFFVPLICVNNNGSRDIIYIMLMMLGRLYSMILIDQPFLDQPIILPLIQF